MWNDKAPIYFLATKYVSDADTTVLRYDAKEHKRMPVTCPAMAKAYNMYLGGTDKNDQLTKLQWCRRHYKWPRRLMVKFFVWNVFYGYVIQNLYKPRIIPGKRIQTFRMFIDELSCVITWWGRVVERWCRCQDAHLQETKHGCITNQTSLFTYITRASGRSNSKQKMCFVFREVQAVQRSESGGQ